MADKRKEAIRLLSLQAAANWIKTNKLLTALIRYNRLTDEDTNLQWKLLDKLTNIVNDCRFDLTENPTDENIERLVEYTNLMTLKGRSLAEHCGLELAPKDDANPS